MNWPTGPEFVVDLETWCAANGTTLSKLAGACQPPVYRSTLTRWRAGAQPERMMWARLQAAMQAHERALVERLLT